MGAAFVLMFFAAITFIPGLILVFVADERGKKVGAAMVVFGIITAVVATLIFSSAYNNIHEYHGE